MEGNWGNLAETLRSLHISGNSISELSFQHDEKKMNFSTNQFKQFYRLRKLVWLDLSANRISHVATNYFPRSLVTIDLSRNILTNIPGSFFEHLHDLKILSLKDNLISHLEMLNTRNVYFEKLDLSLNLFDDLTKFNTSLRVKAINFDKNFLQVIPPDVFCKLGVVHMVLAFNLIEEIHENAFIGLENTLEYLDLERNRLNKIPNGIYVLNKLRYLYFTSNHINNAVYLPSTLRVLSLSGNLFTVIPSGLENCTELYYLNMGYNKISEIEENQFIGWGTQLQTLLLRNNKISSLNYGVFNGLESIKEISLSFNDIHYVHPNVFENISKSLKILELSFGIYRDDFPLEALSHLTELMWLGLDNNNFKIITENSLSSLNQLTYINFAFNRITILPNNIFQQEIHLYLMEIDLSFNTIELINSDTFKSLPELQYIYLSSNKIETIEKYSFYDLPYLMYMDLTYNKLKNISESSFAYLPNLLRLDLMYNELSTISLKMFKQVSNTTTPMKLNISNNRISKFDDELSLNLFVYCLDASNNLLTNSDSFKNLGATLRILYLNGNNLTSLGNHAFGSLGILEILNLSMNNITTLRRRSFQGLSYLQELDLSFNKIEQIQVEQFSNLVKLRVLNLKGNKLKALPRDVFLNTRIEYLDLSENQINIWPVQSFSDVGFTLRNINFKSNKLEYLDSNMFLNTLYLLELILSNNKITVIPDNTFSNLNNLTSLDLSFNPLVSTNFKELFLNIPRLGKLNLKSTGLYSIPPITTNHLKEMDLSKNLITEIISLSHLKQLRDLKISDNKINNLTNFGKHMPTSLKILDISRNPIRKILPHDFNQLRHLEELNVEELKLNPEIFTKLHNLKILKIQSQPNFDEMISKIPGLKKLSVLIKEEEIDDTTFQKLINNTKLNLIEITGERLIKITNNAFYGLSRNHDLTIRIRNTQIDDLPPGIFYSLKDVPKLTIDLSNNMITTLSPDSFYPNASIWDFFGTRSVIGGLNVEGNPLQCDCGLVWLGHWLRRWLRETSQVNVVTKDDVKNMITVSFFYLYIVVLLKSF